MNGETAENDTVVPQEPSVIALSAPRRTVGRPPWQKPGYKIEASPYKEEVARILLTTASVMSAVRFLVSHDLKCDYATVCGFRDNYVATMEQDVKDSILAEARKQQEKQKEEVVSAAVHAHISRVESMVILIEEVEVQMARLKSKTTRSAHEEALIGDSVDRLARLRGELEALQWKSEVERERRQAIHDTAQIAFHYMKERSQAEMQEFIGRCADLVVRKDPGQPQLPEVPKLESGTAA